MSDIRSTHIHSWAATENRLTVTTERVTDSDTIPGKLEVTAITDAILRVRFTERPDFRDPESLMVLPQSVSGSLAVNEDPGELIVTTPDICLKIDRTTLAFCWLDADGNLLTREPKAGGKELHSIPVHRTIWDEDATLTTEKTVDGEKVRATGGTTVEDRMAYSARVRFEFDNNEAVYGFGQHEEGVLNYRGRAQYLYQENMKVAMPVMVSSRGYACLFDTNSLCIFRDDMHGCYFWTEVVEELDYYFIHGPAFDRIIAGIRTLTGRPPMFPKWAFGYVQSKERYVTQQELIDIATEYRQRRLPIDCIVQDWCTWPEGQWGYKHFDAERFPDPDKLAADLHDMNIKLMISIWPHMRGDKNADLDAFRQAGLLLGNQATYDAFLPDARKLYWQQANRGYFKHGIDAWWCDCTEPFEADWTGDVKAEPEQRLQVNTDEAKKYLDPGIINAYSLQHSRGIYEGQRAESTDKRVVNLTRSGFPGQQRYSTVTWSGDIQATWEKMRQQIADGLNFTVTGNPRWTLDIGGFFVAPGDPWFRAGDYPTGCDDLGYRELYTRWFQLGAFLPMFRSHGTDTPREIWRFGDPGSVFYDTVRRFDELRYRLLPYIYSAAAHECLYHYTMFRMLAFDFRDDPASLDVNDQFMFGPALMACPVTHPMYYESNSDPLPETRKSRPVHLPAGTGWTDFWTGKRYPGGQTIEAHAPIDIMPIFVRDGSILPLGPVIQSTAEHPEAPWEIRVYPGADGEFEVYEDEGDSYRCEDGAFATTPLRWQNQENTLVIDKRSGQFPGMTATRSLNIVRVAPDRGTGLTETQTPDATVNCTGNPVDVQV